ncbi:MAG: phosphate ABC transporter permease subunit PstC [Phycisphaerae bacterium]|nr:phosphate ABC transporter permease subunit PstC [Phycisphaerae bacterium]
MEAVAADYDLMTTLPVSNAPSEDPIHRSGPEVNQGARAAAAALRGRPRSAALRKTVERVIRGALFTCAALSVVTTFSILIILARETLGFFGMSEVSVTDFWFGTVWAPKLGESQHFGIWPLVTGTLMVSLVAAVFALPLGLIAAIYLSEYAPSRVRSTLKPVLEILAGIPTVVYGFFALTVITPGLQWFSGAFGSFNATSAGLAVGIMILPIVCSLSEDALRAVPRSLRDGAYALGSTRFDVSVRVVVPAALSGIVAAFLLAITRAIGETMIVALAAGGLAHMTWNPANETQTMTAYMVSMFTGDAPAGSVEYRSSYAVAFVLFILTLGLTLAGNVILRRFREEYE